jgi:type III secretion protein SpaR/YscT/HrcT
MSGVVWEGLTRWSLALALGVVRNLPVTWLVPTLGGAHVPGEVRLALGILLAALGLPHLTAAVDGARLHEANALLLAAVVARELAVGLTVGLVTSFVFRAAEMAGRLVDVVRGANVAEVFVPTSDERGSPVGTLYLFVAAVIFFELGGVGHVLSGLLRSYQAVPLGGGGYSAGAVRATATAVVSASAHLVAAAVALAAPVVVALLLADVVLGILSRVAPQIPVYFVGMPLKALLGIGVTLLGLAALETALTSSYGAWLAIIQKIWDTWAR